MVEGGGMKVFRVNDEEKWMHQNEAKYTTAYVEGTLLDNYILECKRGWCAVYERYATPNSSYHEFRFAPFKNQRECDELWAEFMAFEESVHLAWWMNELAREGSAA
jgi:hypothetical protein